MKVWAGSVAQTSPPCQPSGPRRYHSTLSNFESTWKTMIIQQRFGLGENEGSRDTHSGVGPCHNRGTRKSLTGERKWKETEEEEKGEWRSCESSYSALVHSSNASQEAVGIKQESGILFFFVVITWSDYDTPLGWSVIPQQVGKETFPATAAGSPSDCWSLPAPRTASIRTHSVLLMSFIL